MGSSRWAKKSPQLFNGKLASVRGRPNSTKEDLANKTEEDRE